MPLEIVTVPCLSDNYAFLAHDTATAETAIVDVPEAAPLLKEADRRGWSVTSVFLTHHHHDHVGGLDAVLAKHEAKVFGAAADAHRLPKLDHALSEGDTVAIGTQSGTVIDVSGHTVGHIALHFPGAEAVFTADSLMALGCGRVFEGTMPMMWESLTKLAALPPTTLVYSGHEYTSANAAFAATIDPQNEKLISRIEATKAARAAGTPTVPSALSLELETNPFLRAGDAAIRHQLGMESATDADVFAEIRHRKDKF
jgi:hydroxyacylglutathione hydrolase